jgi:NRPS condensation-like uncharacterized protein
MYKAQRFEIDNAGLLYSSVMTSKRRPRFRFIAVLTEEIEPAVLSRALEQTIPRFPYFHVALKSGFFWHFLEESKQKISLQQDSLDHFQMANPQGPLLRIGHCDRKIWLEMAHVLGDGFGALTFLKTLLVQYYRLMGIDVPFTHGALDINETPCAEEHEDSYQKHSRKILKSIWRETKAYHPESLSREPRKPDEATVVTGIMNTGDVLKKARAYKVSITEYLAAVLAQSLSMLQYESRPKVQLPVKISISSDLRKFYPTRTLRNFSGYCNAGIDPGAGEYAFDEILEEIHHQCRLMLSEKSLNALISKNTGYEKNILLRAMPMFIKKRIITLALSLIGTRAVSMDLTNMGAIELPEAIRDKVERFDTMGGNLHFVKIECGIISYHDKLSVSFSRAIEQPFVENRFFDILVSEGIPVKLELK